MSAGIKTGKYHVEVYCMPAAMKKGVAADVSSASSKQKTFYHYFVMVVVLFVQDHAVCNVW